MAETATERALSLFDHQLRTEELFFFVPSAIWQAFQGGALDTISLEDLDRPVWQEHRLHYKLDRISAGEVRCFSPHLTDAEGWAEIRKLLRLEAGEEYGHFALSDGQVVEFLWSNVRFGRSMPGATRYAQDTGALIVVQKRHLSYLVDKTRRALVRHVVDPANRADVIRAAKAIGIFREPKG